MLDVAEVVRQILEEAWNRKDFTTFPLGKGDRYVLHVGGESRAVDLAETEELVSRWHDAFPDFRFDIHSIVAEGSFAAAHATLRGTHLGRWRDIDPTGRTVAVEHAFFFKFEDGSLRDVWEVLDRSAFDAQLTGPRAD